MERIRFNEVPSTLLNTMNQLENYLKEINLEHRLLELMRVRVSQINNCAYCIDMHIKEALAAGEDIQRLYSLPCWQDVSYFNNKERAVLAWAEKITLVNNNLDLSQEFEHLKDHFSQDDIANLTLAVSTINTWNRLVISFGFEAGHYKVGDH